MNVFYLCQRYCSVWFLLGVLCTTPQLAFSAEIVHYHFNEFIWQGVNGEVIDSINGHNATAINGPTTLAVSPAISGTPGTCRYGQFNGNGQYVEDLNASQYLDGLTAVTVMAWIRNTDSIGNDRGIFSTGDLNSKDNRFSLRYDESGASSGNRRSLKASVNTDACDDVNDCLQVETESDLQLIDDWQHVAMTWASGDKIRIFINGVEVDTTVTGSGIGVHDGALDGIDYLRIGQGTKSGSPGPEWQGNIDEFRIYDQVLSATAITQAMNETHPCVYPLAEYRFEGCDWTTGAVVSDELGNHNGRVVQGAHTAPGTAFGGGLCNVADLHNEGTDFNRYISLADNPISLNTDWTLMMWINFPPEFDRHFEYDDYRYSVIAGGTHDLAWIREHTATGDRYWGASSNPNAHLAPFPDSLSGWHHLTFVGDGANTDLYVDGVFYNSVDYKQTGNYTRMGTTADAVNTNGRQNLDTQLDELKFYDGVLSAAEIASIYNLENSGLRWDGSSLNCELCGIVDHYRLEHTGVGLTCQRSDVTLRACSNADCSTEYAYPTTITLTPTTANPPTWIGGDTRTFTGHQNFQLRQTQPATLSLGLTNPDHVPTNGVKCYDSGVEGDCDIDFYDSGFIFDVPDLTSCQTSSSVSIQAVRTDNTSYTCVADGGFANTTKAVNFWGSYSNPVSGTEQVSLSGTDIVTASPGTGISLDFDANATASFTVTYPDAGQMELNARYEGSGSEEAGLVMSGADSFIVRPVGLCVYSDDSAADCAPGDGSCSAFKKVDENFNLKVKGVCWQSSGDTDFCSGNPTTPNFQLDSIQISHNLLAPTGAGVSLGSIGITTVDITPADSGEAVISNQTVSEVGVYNFVATPPDYFGEPLPVATSSNIGRFIPDHFTTSIVNDGVFANSCSGFTYSGQPFTYLSSAFPEMQITATGISGNTLVNYRNDFVKLTQPTQINMPAVTADTSQIGVDGTLLALTWNPATSTLAANNDGTLDFTLGSDEFIYTRNNNALVAPFTSDIKLVVTDITDSDGVSAVGMPVSFAPTGTTVRYGRMLLRNGYGPETLSLTIPVLTEYYDGSAFVPNVFDNCTPYDSLHLTLTNYQGNLDAGETLATGSGTLLSGSGNSLILSAPGTGNDGSADVMLDLSLATGAGLEWLLPDGNNPSAKATFGIFKGNPHLIYMRESVW